MRILVLGYVQVAAATCTIVSQIIVAFILKPGDHNAGMGIWSGITFLSSGVFEVASIAKSSLSVKLTSTVLSMIALIFCVPLLVPTLMEYLEYKDEEAQYIESRYHEHDTCLKHVMYVTQIIISLLQVGAGTYIFGRACYDSYHGVNPSSQFTQSASNYSSVGRKWMTMLSPIQLSMAVFEIIIQMIIIKQPRYRFGSLRMIHVDIIHGFEFLSALSVLVSGIFGILSIREESFPQMITLIVLSIFATISYIPLVWVSFIENEEYLLLSASIFARRFNGWFYGIYTTQFLIRLILLVASVFTLVMTCRAICCCYQRKPDAGRVHYINNTERQEEENLNSLLKKRQERKENAFTLINKSQEIVTLDETEALPLDSIICIGSSGNFDDSLLNGTNNEMV